MVISLRDVMTKQKTRRGLAMATLKGSNFTCVRDWHLRVAKY